ncbi:MAG: integrase [Coxiella sp. DG_40]|nr:MAG: integrase [Coxiella sp. DG_40]
MANIEERKNKDEQITYRAKIRLKGYPAQTATFNRKTDAKKWVQQVESAIREGRYFKTSEAKRHTLSEMIDRFVKNELPKLPKVQKLMTSQLLWWKNQIGHHILSDVTPALIAELRDKLYKQGTSTKRDIKSATVNRYLTALSIAFSMAVKEWGWLDDTPMRKVKKLKEPKERVRFLEDKERARLLEACKTSANPYLHTLVVLAFSTGARKMELLNIKWKDIDFNRSVITLHETKNEERRILPLTGYALELINKMSRVRRIDTQLLFPSKKDPNKPINIRDPWVKALKKAEIEDFRFHDLRHSAASYLAMNGASLAEIAEVLGHKTLQMVKRYAHLSEAHTAKVVAKMNEKIFGSRL